VKHRYASFDNLDSFVVELVSQATIQNLTAYTSDNVPVTVAGSLFFRVKDSYNACFSVNEFHENVKSIGTSAIRSVIGFFSVS
jgi:regulator of protease activity HflC (stomatin/prohibitin superfamily)